MVPLRLCPAELHLCDRPACESGFCEMSLERLLTACRDCGVVIAFHRSVICVACEQSTIEEEA